MLLDGGSQRSYITERARKMLNLSPTSEQNLSIAAFGSTRGKSQVCPVVKVGVVLKGQSNISISLFVIPMNCEPIDSQSITERVDQSSNLAGLELADWADPETKLEVDILVGADYYWDLVTGATARSVGGPTAIHTKLGWVLSSPVPGGISSSYSTNMVRHSARPSR